MLVDGHDGERYHPEDISTEKLLEIRVHTAKAVQDNDIPGLGYWRDQLDDIDAELDYRRDMFVLEPGDPLNPDPRLSKYVLEQGSIYNPGWVVYERIAANHLKSHGTFDEKSDAEEFLAYLQAQEV